MNGREDYIRRKNQVQRPSINFTQRDDVRDLMKSPMGQNYGRMMDLQGQALRQGGFDRGDPRVAELKDARKQYNRHDKYRIGNLMGYKPLDVQEIYRQNSGVLREHAGPTYKEMYPISDIAHQVVGSGGLTGMLIQNALGGGKKLGKNFFDDLRTMGSDIASAVGITGAVDDTQKEQDDYVAKTFGFYPSDVHPELQREEGQLDFPELPQEDLDVMAQYPVVDYQAPIGEVSSMRSIGDRGTVPYGYEMNALDAIAEDDYRQGIDVRAFPPPDIPDYPTPEPIEPLPFDDSGREAGIAALYGQGPSWAETDRRYEDEYRDYTERMGDMVGGPMTYEEFARAYERIHQGKPHAGLR